MVLLSTIWPRVRYRTAEIQAAIDTAGPGDFREADLRKRDSVAADHTERGLERLGRP